MPKQVCCVQSHCHSPSKTCSTLLWTNWGPLQDLLQQPHPLVLNKELQEGHWAIQIHMGSSGQQPTISNQMGHSSPCSTLQMRYTTMWRLPHRENGDSHSKSSHHAKQEGRNCIYMLPPCQVIFFFLPCCPLFVINCIFWQLCAGSNLWPDLITQEVYVPLLTYSLLRWITRVTSDMRSESQ